MPPKAKDDEKPADNVVVHRAYTAEPLVDGEAKDDAPKQIRAVISSETPVRDHRDKFYTVLRNRPESLDVSALQSGKAFLYEDHGGRMKPGQRHYQFANQIGKAVPGSVQIADGKTTATFRMFSDTNSQAAYQKIADGADNVSIGFTIHERARPYRDDKGRLISEVTKASIFEVSVVGDGLDPNTGVTQVFSKDHPTAEEIEAMDKDEETEVTAEAEETEQDEKPAVTTRSKRRAPVVIDNDPDAAQKAIEVHTRTATKAIEKAEGWDEMVPGLSGEIAKRAAAGQSYDELVGEIDDRVQLRFADIQSGKDVNDGKINCTDKDVNDFSLVALAMHHKHPNNKEYERAAAHTVEMCNAAMERTGTLGIDRETPGDYRMPVDVLLKPICDRDEVAEHLAMRSAERGAVQFRAAIDSQSAPGSAFTADQFRADSFVELLRNANPWLSAGVRRLASGRGNIRIPVHTKGTTAGFVGTAEFNSLLTPGEIGGNNITMNPHEIMTFARFTPSADALQQPFIDSLLMQDLINGLNELVDKKITNGRVDGTTAAVGATNDDQLIPKGILAYTGATGINVMTPDTDGTAPSEAVIQNMRKTLAKQNIPLGRLALFCNPDVAFKMQQTTLETGTERRLWDPYMSMAAPVYPGMRGYMSNNMPATFTQGAATDTSQMILCDPAELFYAEWTTGMDILIDPYSQRVPKNVTEISVVHLCSWAPRRTKAFAAYRLGVLTT